jgi:GNAT superfamily N-acetyltransferase
MFEIIDSLSHPGLEKMTEALFQIAGNYIGHLYTAKFYKESDAAWFITGVPGFNIVVNTQFTRDTPESKIDEMLKHIVASGLPMTWIMGPSMRHAGMAKYLQAHGWLKNGEIPSMALDLANLEIQKEKPEGLTIELVDNNETLKHYTQTAMIGFEFPEPVIQDKVNAPFNPVFLEDPAIHHYLGRINGQPVATTVLLRYRGIVGIYNVSTIPRMRHRGIGKAITLTALHEARNLGYHVAVLHASHQGFNIYRQLGFQEQFVFASYNYPGHDTLRG